MPRKPDRNSSTKTTPNSLRLTLSAYSRSRHAGNSFCLQADQRGGAIALHAQWSMGAIQAAVKLEERAVFGALGELEDFGLFRRERIRDHGRVSGLAYSLCPPPAKLPEPAKARLRSSLLRKQTKLAQERRNPVPRGSPLIASNHCNLGGHSCSS